jgi:ribose transport system permease protein
MDRRSGSGDEATQTGAMTPAPRSAGRFSIGNLAYTYSVVWALLVVVVVFSLLEPDTFFTRTNAQSILGSQAVLLILSIGLIIPLTTNEFDLSIGAMAAFSQVLLGQLTAKSEWPLLPAAMFVVVVCAAIGAFTATLVVKLGVASFVTTLGVGTLLDGLSIRITNSATIPNLPDALGTVAATKVLGVQAVFWYGTALVVVAWYVYRHTPLGQWLYITGASRDVARLNGIKTDRVRFAALVTSATIAAVAGILYAGVYGSADPFSGRNFLLPAFAAVFLGATSFTPGRFNPWGTFFAVYLVITGIVGLSLVTGQVGWISFVFNGAVLIVAVSFQRIAAIRRSRSTSVL